MTAKDSINPTLTRHHLDDVATVASSMPLSGLIDMVVSRHLDCVAITADDGSIIGYADTFSILALCGRLFPLIPESTEITAAISAEQYSASTLARAVEDANAHLLNLNVVESSSTPTITNVVIRVNHSHGEAVARSLERYGYVVTAIAQSSLSDVIDDTTASRARELLHYLEI